jgi:trans-2,3-dihydro-3-hydroxyanthranilate isomerase
MSERRYVTVDVFTDQAFGGNPLAVVLDAQGLDSAAMQSIAKEFNYSETTFVLPPADPAHTAHIRIFTPAEELPFAGHPNVGTAYVLAREGNAAPGLLFEEAAGLVPVAILRAADEVIGAELTAPQPLQRATTISTAAIAACLSLAPGDIVTSVHEPVIASVGTKFVLAELATRDALRRAQPDFGGFSTAFAGHSSNKLYVYTRDGGHGFDLHSRMFAPMGGMREDPATGSATVTLAALLAEAGPDGETNLHIEQGRDMGRPSTLITRTIKHDGVVRSAHVGGRCVTMMRGVLTVP